ncbi:hypothetical protein QR680_011607 [Steinernema hermaphroditum]|uniref:Uncharacterized protein n=1 Tax=Steinernema hermaphroditum TaxID=289476 RepID=A0AA39LYY8_9BILA|nr:hypothetical protein QR680_011607 [Steinernema hermaphroditum]
MKVYFCVVLVLLLIATIHGEPVQLENGKPVIRVKRWWGGWGWRRPWMWGGYGMGMGMGMWPMMGMGGWGWGR